MTSNSNTSLAELRDGPMYRFADWPNAAVPNGRIGVYTVWRDDQLIYVGMAGREISRGVNTSDPASARLAGLRRRLASHASGRRSGDQFCVYIFDRFVLPMLSREQIQDAAQGQLSLDGLTRQLIRQSLSYRFTLLSDAIAARAVERVIQHDGLTGVMPLLNPLRSPPQQLVDAHVRSAHDSWTAAGKPKEFNDSPRYRYTAPNRDQAQLMVVMLRRAEKFLGNVHVRVAPFRKDVRGSVMVYWVATDRTPRSSRPKRQAQETPAT